MLAGATGYENLLLVRLLLDWSKQVNMKVIRLEILKKMKDGAIHIE